MNTRPVGHREGFLTPLVDIFLQNLHECCQKKKGKQQQSKTKTNKKLPGGFCEEKQTKLLYSDYLKLKGIFWQGFLEGIE